MIRRSQGAMMAIGGGNN